MAHDAPARAAEHIAGAYAALSDGFLEVTRRAAGRFARREWRQAREDAQERLALYPRAVERAVREVAAMLDGQRERPEEAVEMKWLFLDRVAEREDLELAETFFNSVTRRVFRIAGSVPEVEFTETAPVHGPGDGAPPLWRAYAAEDGISAVTLERVLGELAGEMPWEDRARDARLAWAAAREQLGSAAEGAVALEMLPAPFFRNKGAYLVGRVRRGRERGCAPLVLALVHDERGVRVDAVLATEDDACVLFGFTRSYLHVDTERPCAVVEFLRSVLPRKPVHELYTTLGFYKHGKTELYRELAGHLARPGARFEVADGIPGLVMSVFTLPSLEVVFKVIKDRFGPSKESTREQVREKYSLVFGHDRVGRLADAQEFTDLRFPRRCFPDELLRRLLAEAGETVHQEDDAVVVRHAYTERRVRPLDLFLREAEPGAAREAVADYGQAIRDLAAANLFPGDLLLKNFGVTRHGRVVFYDYDEISLLSECRFRALPAARHDDDEISAEPWFSVDPGDVFPEEFLPFLIPPGPLRDAFLEAHADLLTAEFWRGMQERQAAGELPDFYPYKPNRRLRTG